MTVDAEPLGRPSALPHEHEPDEVPHSHPDAGVDPHAPLRAGLRALRVGIGGPVGAGKTALVATLCRTLAGEWRLAVVANDNGATEAAAWIRSHMRRSDRHTG
ncbi:GTP-binding protein [Plantactinospora sp. WMMB334]|uniref:GTP-binding protein n=1 Tax=Plantactinospora sp. WMMB334 TaxID=3404119 RepID=UPI003B946542